MTYRIYVPLTLALLGGYATAAVLTAPTATITPAPLLKARDVTTVGYISNGTSGGTTLWDTVTVNDQNQIIATSSNLFQICDPSQVCEFFYCSNDYVVYPSSSFYCGMSNETCSSYVLATDIYDQAPLTNYWCDSTTQTGGIIYEVTPDGSEGLASAPVTDTDPSTDPAAEPSDGPSDSSSNSHSSSKTPKKKKKSPAGAIAGGVIGGLVVLGAIIFGVVFCLRKKRKNAQPQTHAHPQAPPTQQPPPVQYYGNEQKPVGVEQVQQMSPPQQMPPQQQYYDPNAQQQAPQFYNLNAQPAYGQQAGQGGYTMPEKTPAATNMQANPYYADNGGMSGPASPVPVYTPTPAMSPANAPVINAPPANINELPTPPLASFNELPAQRM